MVPCRPFLALGNTLPTSNFTSQKPQRTKSQGLPTQKRTYYTTKEPLYMQEGRGNKEEGAESDKEIKIERRSREARDQGKI